MAETGERPATSEGPAPQPVPSAPTSGERPSPQPASASGQFQPRVEAEEGDPTRGDYLIGVAVAAVLVLALLWAFGVISF